MRERFREGGAFEEVAGYSRAVRHGSRIAVSGTADTSRPDAEGQTRAALERALAAVERLGGRREDVIRTRIYLAPGADWEGAARAHRELLGDIAPANTTLYVGGLIVREMLVEVEVEAELET